MIIHSSYKKWTSKNLRNETVTKPVLLLSINTNIHLILKLKQIKKHSMTVAVVVIITL